MITCVISIIAVGVVHGVRLLFSGYDLSHLMSRDNAGFFSSIRIIAGFYLSAHM